MEVEVKQAEGFYLKAVVNDISDEGLEVIYDKGWRQPEMVKYEQCRTIITDCGLKTNFKAGDIIDAFVRIDQNGKEEVCAWNRMKIRYIQDDFAVAKSIEGSSTSFTDTVPITLCRHPALTSSISSSTVKNCEIDLDNELLEYFSRNEEAYKVLQESVPMILIKLDKEGKKLVVKTFSYAAIKKVDILKDTFLSKSRQKMDLRQRLEEQKKILIRAEEEEIRRKLYLSRCSPYQHSNNSNKNNGHSHPSQSFRQNDQTRQRHQGGHPQQQNQDSRKLNGGGREGIRQMVRGEGYRGGGRQQQQQQIGEPRGSPPKPNRTKYASRTRSKSATRPSTNTTAQYMSEDPRTQRGHHHRTSDFYDYEYEYMNHVFEAEMLQEETNFNFRQKYEQQHQQQREREREDASPLLLILVMFFGALLICSNGSPYSLNRDNTYHVQRYTRDLRVPYFVKPDFGQTYRGNVHQMEHRVEKEHIGRLRSQCYKENYREKLLWTAIVRGDAELWKRAREMENLIIPADGQ